jgi:hypothetical protein
MKTSIFFLTVLILPSFHPVDNCKRIPNGRYKVDITTEGYEDFELIIDGEKFLKLTTDRKPASGTIEWLDCDFILNLEERADSLGMIRKTYNLLGDPVYEIDKTTGKRIQFRLTRKANRHITINEGKLIKLK